MACYITNVFSYNKDTVRSALHTLYTQYISYDIQMIRSTDLQW